MTRTLDHTGQVFGRLTAIRKINGEPKWLCLCVCGTQRVVYAGNLRAGRSMSCGCLCRELAGESSRTHGMCNVPEYNAWCHMRSRCNNPSDRVYALYGGRGITVCDRWLNSFENFYADMGPKPGARYSIDRMNNDGDYEPNNCQWTTAKNQNRNRRTNKLVQYLGREVCIAEASELSGIQPGTLLKRIRLGWSGEDLFLPVKGSA